MIRSSRKGCWLRCGKCSDRRVKEGEKTFAYGWLDKVMQVAENGKTTQSYSYDISGRLAPAYYGDSRETFLWDGLALLSRNNLKYVNEPAVTGGNPILAGDKMLFDDMLGNTLGVKDGEKFSAIDRDAFGELKPGEKPNLAVNFFTGKPEVDGLGYSFLFRNYRADLGKWQTTDPLGYPDGWNNLAYVNNWVIGCLDALGTDIYHFVDSKAVGGLGHSAIIIETKIEGPGSPTLTTYSYYSMGSGENFSNQSGTGFSTYKDAVAALQKTRTDVGKNPYDKIQKWDTDYAQAIEAEKVAKKLMEATYIPGPNDCLSLLYDCLEAAGVPFDNLGQWPVWAFERNIDKTTVILE